MLCYFCHREVCPQALCSVTSLPSFFSLAGRLILASKNLSERAKEMAYSGGQDNRIELDTDQYTFVGCRKMDIGAVLAAIKS